MGKIRGTHSSPGIYTQITDLQYAAKNLGITTLGLVGETEKGPAFEPIPISKWDEFYATFGGTNAELFKDSKYPKYELPYIAKSYLKASDQLFVCRVLGLSGYKAGKAFVITAEKKGTEDKYVVAILRSRGSYKKYANVGDACTPISKYDTLVYDCDEVVLSGYTDLSIQKYCNDGEVVVSGKTAEPTFDINSLNYGQFTIICKKDGTEVGRYPVSFNPGAKNYVYKVLGCNPTDGNAAVFIEELYDVMLEQLILNGSVNAISNKVSTFEPLSINAIAEPVKTFVNIPASHLKRGNLNQTFVYSSDMYNEEESAKYHKMNGATILSGETEMQEGGIYKVKSYVSSDGIKKYVYTPVMKKNESGETTNEEACVSTISGTSVDSVLVLEYDSFVGLNADSKVIALADMSDYHESFRCASTPWIVSELKGDGKTVEVKKLFRFHTITDGNYANQEVKISITNILPDEGRFDVIVRDFNDSDANPIILESYKGLTMTPNDSRYIGMQIGTLDGAYELRSNYVMVEIIENEMTAECVPCGFLGYPVRDYGELIAPTFEYNRYYDEDLKDKRQYFGLSDISGVDIDMLNYKGKAAYTGAYNKGYTRPFHLDSTLDKDMLKDLNITVSVDGEYSDLDWAVVSPNNGDKAPVIGSEDEMEGTIYENVKVRKFTVYPCGGFDGWDIYRKARTNTNEFKANKYKGTIINGHGETFSKLTYGEGLGLTGNCITSDYYAYLAGINQFENPEKYIINLFATPGIDYINNENLVEDAIEMVENRLDTLYVVTTPDKPWGASDAVSDMYSSKEAAANLKDSDIDTYYAATYYPWVKYLDKDNSIYINLPATKDVLRNMADVDNKRYPWIAPAGMERGNVECTKMHFPAKIDDRDNVYNERINALASYAEGVKVWGNKTMYICEETNPMNRINTVRLMLYMRRLIIESTRGLIFDPDDATLREQFESIVKPILAQIKADRGITDYKLETSQTPEQMDLHELSCKLWVKPTPALEYIEINFMVTPQGIMFE